MDPIAILAIANGVVSLLEKLVPEIASEVSKGNITIEQQKAIWARVDAVRPGGAAFQGPEWVPSK